MNARAIVFTLLASGMLWSSGACRSIEVCSGAACSDQELMAGGTDTAGGRSSAGSAGRTTSGAPAQGLGGETSGEAGDASLAGGSGTAGEASAPEPLVCEPNMADCDGSRLTGCETDITWGVRHCGGCGQLCTGLCLGGECQESLVVQPIYVDRMVATDVTGYAVASGSETYSVLKIDLGSGVAASRLDKFEWPPDLALSGDRLYVLDTTEDTVRSMALDGSDLVNEDFESPDSIGGTLEGAYYVSTVWHEENPEAEQYEYRLFFRATGGSKWELLRTQTRPLRIVSSTAQGLVLGSFADDYTELTDAELSVWSGKISQPLTERPKVWRQIKVANDGSVVMLADDDETGAPCLWWKQPDEESPTQYLLESSDDVSGEMLVSNDGVALYFASSGRDYVQQFGPTGPDSTRLGLPPESNPVWMGQRYLWHVVADTWITWRFLRSEWLSLDL